MDWTPYIEFGLKGMLEATIVCFVGILMIITAKGWIDIIERLRKRKCTTGGHIR